MTPAPCHARCVRWSWLLVLVASSAHAAPRMTPFVETPGIALGGVITAAAFCETTQRAVFRLTDGNVVAVGSGGGVTKLGSVGAAVGGHMVCDRTDRIVVGTGKKLITLSGGVTKTETTPAAISYLRVLDDGAIGIVEQSGAVSRFGTTRQQVWTTGRVMLHPLELDGTGERIVSTVGNTVEVTDRNGKRNGPVAMSVTWVDSSTVLYADRLGLVGRWQIDKPTDQFTKVEQLSPPHRIGFRVTFHRAGKRMLLVRNDGPITVLALDGSSQPVMTSRLPNGRRMIAAGDVPFAFVAVIDRAVMVDLTRSSYAIDHDRQLGPVDGMAFSPDGRSLAMLSSHRDIIIAPLTGSSYRTLSTTHFVHGPLTWAPDGTLFAAGGPGHVRWNLDGTVEARNERALGFTSTGAPVTLSRDSRLVIERGHVEQSFPIDRAFGVMHVAVTDRYLVARGIKRVEVYALSSADARPVRRTRDRSFLRDAVLVGETNVMYVDDSLTLYLADAKGDRELHRYTTAPMLAASPDRKRVAAASRDTVTIWDDRGQRTAELTTGSFVRSLVWSPDLRTLAVSTRDGIELWTIPTDERQ